MIEDLNVTYQEGKICQICEVVFNLEETVEKYYNTLGFGSWYFWDFIPPNLYDYYYKGVKVNAGFRIAVAQVGPIQYELTQPLFGMSIHRDFLDKNGEGIHHVKIYYKDIEKALKEFAKKNIYVLQEGKYKSDWHVYLDTQKEFGIIWELGNCMDIGNPDKKFPI